MTATQWTVLAAAILAVAAPVIGQTPDTTARRLEVCAELEQLAAVLGMIRERNAPSYAITGEHGIDQGRYLTVGGIEQWITIRGEDRRNPVLLLLHGGPGDATNPWSHAILRSWFKRFTVVQWDQRGTGRTLGKTGPSVGPTISIDRLTRDGIDLAEHLRTELGATKLLLVGHSWGSILGVLMAKARPDLFSAMVGTGQVADPARNYSVAYRQLLAHAERVADPSAIAELEAVGPPPYPDGRGYRVQRTWANLFERSDLFIASMLGLAASAPGYTIADINDWIAGQGLSAERIVPESSRLPAAALGGSFALPVFVIQGADDYTTPTSLARQFVASLHAPRKAFVTIEGAGHFAAFTHPEAFLAALVTRVLPAIRPATDSASPRSRTDPTRAAASRSSRPGQRRR